MSIELNSKFRKAPPAAIGRSVKARLRRLERGQNRVKELNGSSEDYDLSGYETLHSYQTANVTVGSGPTAIRFTDIIQGDGENERQGDRIRLMRLTGDVQLQWIGLEGADNIQQFNRLKKVQVRMMVVQVFDQMSEDASFQPAPSLVDIFQHSTPTQPSLGTFPPLTFAHMEAVMGGPYRSGSLVNPEGTAAEDASFLRQRNFKVWFDWMETIAWQSQAIPIYDGASAYEWVGGIKSSNTNVETGGANDVSRFYAHKLNVPIDVKLGTFADYLEGDTATAANVRGNLYFYIFSGHGLTTGINQTSANWPTSNGLADVEATKLPQIVWRHRFRLFFRSE